MKFRLLTSVVLLVAGIPAVAIASPAADSGDLVIRQLLNQKSATPNPDIAGRFQEYTVGRDDSVVAETASYSLTFRVSETEQLALHLGGFVIGFPDGFDITRAVVGELQDDHPELVFRIRSSETAGNTLTIDVDKKRGASGPVNTDSTIVFTLAVSSIVNPLKSGPYQLAALAYDNSGAIMAGPALSDTFTVMPGRYDSLALQPIGDTTLAAGSVIDFDATGLDRFGNPISGIMPVYSFAPDSDPIGTLSGNVLLATRVGSGTVLASFGGVTAASGTITVTPGPLGQIALDIPVQQLVDRPLLGPATVTFSDSYGNVLTAHDLSDQPLALSSLTGQLEPALINSNEFFHDGVIDLAAAGVTYHGLSAQTVVTASIGGVQSSGEAVSFSGYDIVEVRGADDSPLSRLRAGSVTTVRVVVRNNGLLVPSAPVDASSVLLAHGGGDTVTISGSANGQLSTITLLVPVPGDAGAEDTLDVRIQTAFTLAGQTYSIERSVRVPVALVDPIVLRLVSEAIGPDSIYPGDTFPLSIAIEAVGLGGAVDSSGVRVTTADGRELFVGRITPSSVSGDTLFYNDLQAVLPLEDMNPTGPFTYLMGYALYSGGQLFNLQTESNAATILPLVSLDYVAGSLAPRLAAAGYQASFQFSVDNGTEYPVQLEPALSSITVSGTGFSASTSFQGEIRDLSHGENVIITEQLFIPENQLGLFLSVSGRVVLLVPSAGASDTVAIDFAGETIEVRDLPVVQVVELYVVAPNAPNVNTGQAFQLCARVANLSALPVGPLTLALSSDGESTFDTLAVVDLIEAEDTTSVYFGAVAAAEANPAEIFRLDIRAGQSGQPYQQPPADDVALVRIQEPAQLTLEYTLFGAPNGIVDRSSPFGLTVEINNQGEAATGQGSYRLTTGGVVFGANDTLTGTIDVGPHLEFTFTSPSFDTSAVFLFELLTVPNDLNVGQPAPIDAMSFWFEIRVESQDADLFVEVLPLGSNLVKPSGTKDMFEVRLTNRGTSTITSVRLESMAVGLEDADGDPLGASAVFNRELTHVLEGSDEVPVELLFGEQLLVNFDDLTIASGEAKALTFRGGFVASLPKSFTVQLGTGDFSAVFEGGSAHGDPVRVDGPDGQFLFSRTYVVHGAGLAESFVIENNPFNPRQQPALFAYELAAPSRVEFRVFTLTGEEVYAEDVPYQEGTTGEQQFEWDGRNDEGGMVSNGVYIVSIKVASTGEQALMKVAVVK